MTLGVDLLSISRFRPIAAHPRASHLLFTERELCAADSLGEERRGEFLSGRFCAKEAVAKVLRRGHGQGLSWREIEVLADDYGAPVVTLTGGALGLARRAGVRSVELSITHQADLVVCVAMAPGAGRPGSTEIENREDTGHGPLT